MKHVLLLSNVRPIDANTIHDHHSALILEGGALVYVINPLIEKEVSIDFSVFDAVIIHYSIVCFSDYFINPAYRGAIRNFRGLKVIFIQDEYRSIYPAIDAMIDLGIDVLFTLVSGSAVDLIYGQLRRRGVRVETTLTGYVPDNLVDLPRRPISERPLDVVYRGRVVPYSLGRLGTEKVTIAQRFSEIASRYCLKADVDWREEARIYGDRWARFLSSGRTALGTESGASICDFTGGIDRALKRFVAEHPAATFEDAYSAFLFKYEGNVMMNVVSPRVFESIALGTALVQFPGGYSGVLRADDHYVPLQKDFSNIEAVVEAIRDTSFLEKLAGRAYDDIIRSGEYSYRRFARQVFAIMREEWERRVFRHAGPRLGPAGAGAADEWTFEETFLRGGGGGDAPQHDTSWEVVEADAPTPPESQEEWRREIEATVHRRKIAEAEQRAPRNLALANEGATISASSPFFQRPHDADYLLRAPMEGGYAAAEFGFPEYFIEIDLGRVAHTSAIQIEWYSEDNYPKVILVEKSIGAEISWSPIFQDDKSNLAALDVPLEPGTLIRRLRVTVSDFFGQPRMLIRSLRVFERPEEIISFAPDDGMVNVLDFDYGASVVSSSAFFPPPHHPGYLLHTSAVGGYAAALDGTGAPQWIEFDLGGSHEIRTIEITWYSGTELAVDFSVDVRGSSEEGWISFQSVTGNWREASILTTAPIVARRVRISATRFTGQQRMLVRALRVWALRPKAVA
jgi:hypothetical protein